MLASCENLRHLVIEDLWASLRLSRLPVAMIMGHAANSIETLLFNTTSPLALSSFEQLGALLDSMDRSFPHWIPSLRFWIINLHRLEPSHKWKDFFERTFWRLRDRGMLKFVNFS